MKERRTSLARWGLLVTTVAMGAVLVVTGTTGFLGARRSADAVARAAVGAMALAARRDLARAPDRQRALDELRAELAGQGLAFVGLVERGGGVVLGSGAAVAGLEGIGRPGLFGHRPGPQVEPVGRPGGARAVLPLRGGAGRGRLAAGDAGGADGGLLLVLEARPAAATAILSRGLVGLVTSLAATGILIAAAVVFWRLSRRADRQAAQLARDERLKVLGRMSAVLGHEIRNPLAALKGHAQLLLESLPDDHPGRRGAKTVVREAERLEHLTGQVLAFARDLELAPVETGIAGLLRGAAEHAGADPVEVRVAPAASSWRLDPERMDQVLVNLLINARQASPPGEPVVLEAAVGGGRLVLEVRDRGPGFDPETVESVFEPFQTTRVHGTGLGLHLARLIVERHGGRIAAGNREGGGALVRIELPPAAEGGAS
jgi:signal transduction histidine kinase